MNDINNIEEQEPKENENEGILEQIRSEYSIAYDSIKPKRDEWKVRMRLYNNQKRDKMSFGDPLLFTIMQTILASLYDNKMGVTFLGNEQGDVKVAENQTATAKHDYIAMDKPYLDYFWDWDACFYGTSLVLMTEYSRKLKLPIPARIDMMTFYVDPRAISMDGHFGRGAARYWGRDILMTKREMMEHPDFFNVDEVTGVELSDRSIDDAKQARSDMDGTQDTTGFDTVQGENKLYALREHYTYIDGKRTTIVVANEGSLVVRKTVLADQTSWGVVERQIYPVSDSFWGTSIPDLVEDKQRLRAKLLNIAAKGVEFGVYPQYIFDNNKLTNPSELLRPDANKFVGIDGEVNNAIQPLVRNNIQQDVMWMLDTLNYNAEKSTATPAISQGATPDTGRTATERALQQQGVDKRYSLAAKLFSNSEKKFWEHWYKIYKRHFKDFDKKVLRIVGPVGYEFRPLLKSDLITSTDPDIVIEDSVTSESMRLQQLQSLSNVVQIIAQNPQINRNFLDKELARLSGLDTDQVNMLIPKTSEQLHAEEENKLLELDKKASVKIDDDHMTHIEIHNMATDTASKRAHIKTHYVAMMKARTMKEQLPMTPEGIAGVPTDQQPQMGASPTPGNKQDQSQISPTKLNFGNNLPQ